jgi:hypothetical protein
MPPLTHDECRQRVCATCFNKVSPINKKQIQGQIIQWMKLFVCPSFDPDDVRFPTILCCNCYTNLQKMAYPSIGSAYHYPPITVGINYNTLVIPPLTRQPTKKPAICRCQICRKGSVNGMQLAPYTKIPKGRPR